jgi:hypothetical protein
MHEHAQFENGGTSVEAGVLEMADRMPTLAGRGGRWKVFKGANDAWLEEYGMYHRRDGYIIIRWEWKGNNCPFAEAFEYSNWRRKAN